MWVSCYYQICLLIYYVLVTIREKIQNETVRFDKTKRFGMSIFVAKQRIFNVRRRNLLPNTNRSQKFPIKIFSFRILERVSRTELKPRIKLRIYPSLEQHVRDIYKTDVKHLNILSRFLAVDKINIHQTNRHGEDLDNSNNLCDRTFEKYVMWKTAQNKYGDDRRLWQHRIYGFHDN